MFHGGNLVNRSRVKSRRFHCIQLYVHELSVVDWAAHCSDSTDIQFINIHQKPPPFLMDKPFNLKISVPPPPNIEIVNGIRKQNSETLCNIYLGVEPLNPPNTWK